MNVKELPNGVPLPNADMERIVIAPLLMCISLEAADHALHLGPQRNLVIGWGHRQTPDPPARSTASMRALTPSRVSPFSVKVPLLGMV